MLIRSLVSSVVSMLAAGLVASACTTSDAPPSIPDSATPPIAVEDFDARLGDALCQLWVRCGTFTDLAACEAAGPTVSWATRTQRAADLAAGTAIYNGSKAADCIAVVTAATCAQPQFADVYTAIDACPVFELGVVADGGACTHGSECASTNCQQPVTGDGDTTCTLGTCEPLINDEGNVCGQGLACDGGATCVDGVCRKAGPDGSTCAQDGDCATAYCVYGDGVTGTCAERPPVNTACDDRGCATIGEVCVTAALDDYYNPINRCVQLATIGDDCSVPGEITPTPPCRRGSVCDPNYPSSYTCVALPTVGQTCVWGSCAPDAYCDLNDTCVPVKPTGAACVYPQECGEGDCEADVSGGPTTCRAGYLCAQ